MTNDSEVRLLEETGNVCDYKPLLRVKTGLDETAKSCAWV